MARIMIDCSPRILWDCIQWYIAELQSDMMMEAKEKGYSKWRDVNPEAAKIYDELLRVERQLEEIEHEEGQK